MSDGITIQLDELIDLRRFAQKVQYKPEAKVLRSGLHCSKLRGRGMDFAEVRNYQAGDEIRHMEWRVTARTGRPHIKLYQEERERPVILLSEFNPSMFFGTRVSFKSVVAARLAALIAWTVIKQGDRVGGLFFSTDKHAEFIPRSREMGVLPLLASLSEFTISGSLTNSSKTTVLSEMLMRVRRVMRPGSILVLISDFYNLDADCEKHLSRLRLHNDILAYQVCDPLELAPPQPQQYAITNGQQELLLDTSIVEVAKAYQNYFEQRSARLNEQFKRLKIPHAQLTAEDNLTQLVHQTFPRRAHG